MNSFSRPHGWCQVLFIGTLFLGMTYPSAAESGLFERRHFAYAKRAFQDQLYDVAKSKLESFREKYPDSIFSDEARWLLGQSELFLGNAQTALAIFSEPPSQPQKEGTSLEAGFLLWKGQALRATGDLDQAIETFRTLITSFPDHDLILPCRIELSKTLFQAEKFQEAEEVLGPLFVRYNDREVIELATLQKARLQIGKQHLEEALDTLDQLPLSKLTGKPRYEAAYLKGKTFATRERFEEALKAFQQITGDSIAFPRELVVKAWHGSGDCLAAQKKWQQASDAYEKAFRLALDSSQISASVLAYLNAQFQNETLTKGALEVRNFVSKNPDTALSGLYAIGRYFFLEKKFDAAISEFSHLVNHYPNSDWIWPARLGIAEALLNQDQRADSLKLLRQITTNAPRDAEKSQAHTLLGETSLADDPIAAADHFLAAAELTPEAKASEALWTRALFAFSEANAIDAFIKNEKAFYEQFPNSSVRVDLLMEKARLFEQTGRGEQARKLYSQLVEQKLNPQKTAQALFRLGLSSMETGNFNQALGAFQALEKDHPNFPRLDEASYRAIRCTYLLGSEDVESIQKALMEWTGTFPNSPLLPRVRNFIGNLLESRGLLSEAVSQYRTVLSDVPHSEEADQSAYWGGKCLFRLKQHQDAIEMLEKVRGTSSWKPYARLTQILCTMHLGNYKSALAIADSLLQGNPSPDIRSFALLRKAECLFTLASEDRSLYPQALSTAEEVLALDSATSSERNEAGFIKGEIYQKLNKSNEALEAFLSVVYSQLLPEETTRIAAQPEFHWFIKSGLAAARIREDQGDIRGAVEIYRILERLGEPNRGEFRRKIEDLKNEYFLYETS